MAEAPSVLVVDFCSGAAFCTAGARSRPHSGTFLWPAVGVIVVCVFLFFCATWKQPSQILQKKKKKMAGATSNERVPRFRKPSARFLEAAASLDTPELLAATDTPVASRKRKAATLARDASRAVEKPHARKQATAEDPVYNYTMAAAAATAPGKRLGKVKTAWTAPLLAREMALPPELFALVFRANSVTRFSGNRNYGNKNDRKNNRCDCENGVYFCCPKPLHFSLCSIF